MKNECPCGSRMLFEDCCRPLLSRKKSATTVEQLMRSRFTAYTHSDWKYIFKTWHKSTRPSLAELRSGDSVDWLGLKVIRCDLGLTGDTTGIVEFIATYHDNKSGEGIAQLKEVSKFLFEDGKWLYLDAV